MPQEIFAQDEIDTTLDLIRQSAGAITRRKAGLGRVRALRFTRPGFSQDIFQEMCGLGWCSFLVSEAKGGSGLGMQALCALLDELGRGLVPEPLLQSAVSAPYLRGAVLDLHLSGASPIMFALQEHPDDLTGVVKTSYANGRVRGQKRFIPMASAAAGFLVSTNKGLALIDRGSSGLKLEFLETQDGGHFGTLTLENAPGEIVSGEVAEAYDRLTLGVSAYLLGIIEEALKITIEYLKTRVQFGRPIGQFQALQHKCADMKISATVARASIESAARLIDSHADLGLTRTAISRAKVKAAEVSLHVTKEAIQLHGAIGYTDEHDVGLFFKKAVALCNLYGSAAVHRSRYASLSIDDENE
jgi:alkylation response protein AidB-like acyl-CoA dehydrogenase